MSKDEVITYIQSILDGIVGDTPVSEQLSAALKQMAYESEVQVLREEIEELKAQVNELSNLVGDISVSEQINNAIIR